MKVFGQKESGKQREPIEKQGQMQKHFPSKKYKYLL